MTTFQDPQPQSRRAVRRSERGESFDTQDPAPLIYPDASAPTEPWDTIARRAAQLPPATGRTDATVATGRRAAPVAPAQPSEPLNYTTVGRAPAPPTPPPAQPTFRRRGTSVPPTEQDAPSAGVPDQPSFRVRDFSPQSGRSATPQAWTDTPATATADSDAQAAPTDLNYHTEARLHYEVPVAPAVQQSPAAPPFEQTMSRRELRAQLAMEQQLGDASAQASGAPAPEQLASTSVPSVFPLAPEPNADTALTNAMAEFDALSQRAEAAQLAEAQRVADQTAARAAEEAARQAQQAAAEQAAAQQAAQAAAQQAAAQRAAQQAAAQQAATQQAATQQAAAQEAAAQQRVAAEQAWAAQQQAAQEQVAAQQAAAQQAAAQVAAQTAAQQQAAQPPQPQPNTPSGWTPPQGHWSAQADAEDHDSYGNSVNRTVGGASATTSALVVQSLPGSNDIRGPLTGTGEIMLTGSIDLPRSFSSTGASARFDPEGMDAFFDAGDAEVISTDSAPVRAIRAISTHNSGQGVTHTQKPKGTRALTVLMISASSMAVVVAGLLVTAFALNVF